MPPRRSLLAAPVAPVAAGLAAAGVLVAGAAPAAAERRPFTRTLEALTQGDGDTEVTLGSAQRRASLGRSSPERFELTLGLVHGVTDRLDLALTHAFVQDSGDGTSVSPARALSLDEVGLRARYRFAERGDLVVDPAAAVELSRRFATRLFRAEARAVLGRDVGVATVALNPLFAVTFGPDLTRPVLEAGWAGGVTVDVRPTLAVGAESWGRLDLDAADRVAAWAGPTLSWAPTLALWVTASAGVGLTASADRVDARLLVGLLL